MKRFFCLGIILVSCLVAKSQTHINFSSCPGKKFWECYREKIQEVVIANANKGVLKEALVNITDKDSIYFKMTYWLNSSGNADPRLFGASLKRETKAFEELKAIITAVKSKKWPTELADTNGAQFFLSLNFRKIKNEQGNIFLESFEWNKKEEGFGLLGFSPIYDGCRIPKKKSLKTSKKSKACLQTKLRSHIAKHFNSKILKDKVIYANKTLRTNTSFIVNKYGVVDEVEPIALTKELENEALRIFKLIPKMIPGELDGKKVNVLYNQPIVVRQ